MAFYLKDMTYEEMMKEFARLVVKMIINDEPNESSQIIDTEKQKMKKKWNVSSTKTRPTKNNVKSNGDSDGKQKFIKR
jgi:hypothetical protein